MSIRERDLSTTRPDKAISIIPLKPRDFRALLPELVDIHLAAMHYPHTVAHQRHRQWTHASQLEGFVCHVAVVHPADSAPALDHASDAVIAGFCFSFRGFPESWWYREILRGLQANNTSPDKIADLLCDYTELSEVHVRPETQGIGIGTELLRAHLDVVSTRQILLSTPEVPNESNAAWVLYRKFGFTDVLRDFHFTEDPRPFGILGLHHG